MMLLLWILHLHSSMLWWHLLSSWITVLCLLLEVLLNRMSIVVRVATTHLHDLLATGVLLLVLLTLDHLHLLLVLIVVELAVVMLFVGSQELIGENLVEFTFVLVMFWNDVVQIVLFNGLSNVLFGLLMNLELRIEEMKSLIQSIKSYTYNCNRLASFNFRLDLFGNFNSIILQFNWVIQVLTNSWKHAFRCFHLNKPIFKNVIKFFSSVFNILKVNHFASFVLNGSNIIHGDF